MPSVHYVHQERPPIDIGEHVFPIQKYQILARLLREELGVPDERWHGFAAVEPGDLERIHRARYLADLAAARAAPWTLSSELPVTHEVIEGFRAVVGGSIATVRLALQHGVGFCIGGGLHHAFADHAEGFCYFHDMAVAVEKQRCEQGLGRVLFVDVDVHQGNGTAVIYADDPDTFSYSIHQENNYPVKQRSSLDRGLDDGTTDDVYLECLARDLERIDAQFASELVCYVAGVDPHREDQLGGLALSDQGLRRRDELVLARYVGRGIPVAVFLAGGYARTPERTARLHLLTARAAERACGVPPVLD
jgi:acetoin utilization deacetylase AcuC-like enzyme